MTSNPLLEKEVAAFREHFADVVTDGGLSDRILLVWFQEYLTQALTRMYEAGVAYGQLGQEQAIWEANSKLQ
jgi:hypothetical protein